MPEFVATGPLWLIFSFLLIVVFCRAQATYWLAFFLANRTIHTRATNRMMRALHTWFTGPIPKRGKAALEKWGLVIIPLSFLTIGFQTAVNAGAGFVSMRWRQYTIAMFPGCLAWAAMYSMGLLAVWTAAVQAITGTWWPLLIVILALSALTWWRISIRRRYRNAAEHCLGS
ncbi:MAG: hypothetical protein Q4Q03_04575 [Bowdeniella nasicola]|nr:hypothetical protein [Bowdeniella nasicola]